MTSLDRLLIRLILALYPSCVRDGREEELQTLYAHGLMVARQRRGLVPPRLRALADGLSGALALRQSAYPARSVRITSSLQDVRFALRTYRHTPMFFWGLVLVLALGTGANAAVFSLASAVLLEPLHVREPDRVVVAWQATADDPSARHPPTAATLLALRKRSDVFEQVAGVRLWQRGFEAQLNLALDEETRQLRGGLVTPNFFTLLGAATAAGRTFTEDDAAAGRTNVIVLSHALWQSAFSGDPSIVGRVIMLTPNARGRTGPQPYEVVGVLESKFQFMFPLDVEAWTINPWSNIENTAPGARLVDAAVARLAPGVTLDTAERRLAGVALQETESQPPASRPIARVETIASWVTNDTRPALLLLAGVAGLLLLAACATIAGALLVRVAERQRELALRVSLGASRVRLIRQLLTEGALLALAGTAAGVGLAVLLLPTLRTFVPATFPRGTELGVNLWFLGFAAAAAAVVVLLATLAPAVLGADVTQPMRRASAAASSHPVAVRWRGVLVAGQAAVAVALLVGASLLLVSFARLGRVDLGFDPTGVFAVEINLTNGRYGDSGARRRFGTELVTRLRLDPGMREVGLTSAVPFRGVDSVLDIPRRGGERRVSGNLRTVDPEYFSILGLRLLRGRFFDSSDTVDSTRVAVLSAALARDLFGDEDPVGRSFPAFGTELQVVGVVGDVRYVARHLEPAEALYRPQSQLALPLLCLIGRAAPGADAQALVRRAVRDIDPTLPAMHFTSISEIIDESTADRRFYTVTTVLFASLALVLTAAGLVVLVSRVVVERRREMAIRAALGAGPVELGRLVTRRNVALTGAGVLAGLALAWVTVRILEPLLFQIPARDPLIFVAAGTLTFAVNTVAGLIPILRLRQVPIVEVLKVE